VAEPVGKRLFKARLDLLSLLSLLSGKDTRVPAGIAETIGGYDALATLRQGVTDELHSEVASMNQDNFIVRTEREHVVRFANRNAWNTLVATASRSVRVPDGPAWRCRRSVRKVASSCRSALVAGRQA
jgi:type I restriction enzyme R subunit